jgi:hypothetical protein
MPLSVKTKSRLRRQFKALWALPNPQTGRSKSIKAVQEGSVFTLRGLTYQTNQIHRYKEGSDWEWWELVCFCINTGEVVYIEWEEDDALEVCLTTHADLSLSKLNLTASRIESVVDEEDSISYGGFTYIYEDDCKAKFFKDDQGKGTKVWIVDYEASDGEHYLSLERWKQEDGTKDWEAHLSVAVDALEIKVLAV